MKKTFIALAAAVLVMCTGCDAFRRLAGRPTAAEVEQMRLEMLAALEAEHQAKLDSMAAVQKALEDSLAAIASAAASTPGTLADFPYRYAVVLGSFGQVENAQKLAGKLRDAGYEADIISLRNGFTSVCVNKTNNRQFANQSLEKIKAEPFCPTDAWLLVNQ